MGEYDIDPVAMNERLFSPVALVYAGVWHSVKWLEKMRYVT